MAPRCLRTRLLPLVYLAGLRCFGITAQASFAICLRFTQTYTWSRYVCLFTWTEVRLVVISYTATPLKATAAQHLNTTQRDACHWAKLWGRYHEISATSRWISFILSGLSATTKTRGRREFQLEEEMKPGDRDRRKPPTGCPALLTAPAGRASPPPQPTDPAPSSLTWGALFHTTTFFPSCSLLSAILFLTCQNPGPRSHDRSCNSCYKSCKGVILLMSHIATQPPLDMRMLRPTKPFPFQDP